jgi:hypothetical protein
MEDLMKANLKRVGAAALAFVATAAGATSAFGQDAQASGQVGMTLPGAAPRATAVQGESDHDYNVGSLAVGYLGRRSMLVGTHSGIQGPALGTQEVNAPVIGIRYWVDELIGIDAGLGFGINSGSVTSAGTTDDLPSTSAFILHGGIPLSLADEGHFSFQIVPEMNIGFANWSQEQPGQAGDLSGSGFHIDIGARAGAEIHFGFIGIPKLSLQGSVGLYFAMDSVSAENEAFGGTDAKSSTTSIGTTVLDNPWNIFTSNVAALYYF